MDYYSKLPTKKWNGEYNYWGSNGQPRYVSSNIWKSRLIWMVGFGHNPNLLWIAVFLHLVSESYLCTWSTTCISGTGPSVNEWQSWSDMSYIANHITLNYVARTGFGWIHTFYIDIYDWSYISCSTNQTLRKPGWWTNYNIQKGNWYKTSSIKPTCFLFLYILQKDTAHIDTKLLNVSY